MPSKKSIVINVDLQGTATKLENTIKNLKLQLETAFSAKSARADLGQLETQFTNFLSKVKKFDGLTVTTKNVDTYVRQFSELSVEADRLSKKLQDFQKTSATAFSSSGMKETLNNLLTRAEKIRQIFNTSNSKDTKGGIFEIPITDIEKFEQFRNAVSGLTQQTSGLEKGFGSYKGQLTRIANEMSTIKDGLEQTEKKQNQFKIGSNELNQVLQQINGTLNEQKNNLTTISYQKQIEEQQKLADSFKNTIERVSGLYVVYNLAKRQISELTSTYRALDESLVSIASVSGKTREDMWGMIGDFNEMANRLGTTTQQVVESSKLYYQQGRSQAEVMKLVEQTTILASIEELDFAEATNYMTAAINGFKLEASEANQVIDIWANLSAQAAVSSQELAVSISKVASIAQSAGMELDTTSAFLTKMVNFAARLIVA